MERTCDGCTKCCEGWLIATIKGQPMYPGKPCQFVQIGKGCATYSTRPKNPCRTYKCAWLQNETIPEWIAPKTSGVIIAYQKIQDIVYVELTSTGQPVTDEVLTWFFLWGLQTVGNIKWWNNHGQYHYYGTQEFADAMSSI